MAQEEPEVSDELREMKELAQEIATHKERVSKLEGEGKMDAETTALELSDTVLPLLSDLANVQMKHAAAMEDWLNDLEDEVENGGGGGSGGLSDEEIDLFGFLFARFRELIAGVPDEAPPEMKQGMLELTVKLDMAQKVLERLKSESEEEEGEGEEDSEEGEDDGDSDS